MSVMIINNLYLLGTFFVMMAGCLYIVNVASSNSDDKEEKLNYKNISLMANNLSNCKVGTRKQVLTDLYKDPDWSEAEVDELKGVLEGMLKTKLTIDKPGEPKNTKIKAIEQ